MGRPIPWLEAFQANTGNAAFGSQDLPQVVGLANGNILVAWQDSSTGTVGGRPGTDIIGTVYDATGDVVRDAFQINQGRYQDDERDFDIAAMNDGGFAMVYVDDDISSPNRTSIIWERYDALGNLTTGATQIADENVAADFLSNPQIAVNQADNSSYVTFTDDVGANTDIRGVRLDATGTTITPEFDAAQNSLDADRNGDIAILKNGNLVSVYEEEDPTSTEIEVRIVRPDGSPVVSFFEASGSGADDFDPQVASLKNGGFVVVWERGDAIQYRVFDENGSAQSNVLNATSGTANTNEPDVAALPDGDFVIVWDNDSPDRTRARRFNPDGSKEGGKFTVFEGNGTGQDVGVTGDGRILMTWDNAGGDEIYASIWDPREEKVRAGHYDNQPPNFVETNAVTAFAEGGVLKGTKAADDLFGSAEDDKIKAGKGNDFIHGRGGDDEILGGDGKDEMIGGGGRNILNGEDGKDLVNYSGVGNAVIVDLKSSDKNGGRAKKDDLISIENAEGSRFDDKLKGDNGKNKLIGNDGDDYLLGRDGKDKLRGGDDADKLKGGHDDDKLWGGDDADRFIFKKGDGDDTVMDFEFGVDKFVVGKGASNLGDLDISQVGSDSLVEFANVSVILRDVDMSDLSASDFII